MNALTPELCRAARGLLAWGQRELAQRANVAHKTIAEFELGARRPYERTLRDITSAFEAGGVVFIEPKDGVHAMGVALGWNAMLGEDGSDAMQAVRNAGGEGLDAQAWDDEIFPDAVPADPDFPPLPITDEMREDVREMLKTVEISPAGRAILTRDFRL
jgi:transcriptional regulator with XRE-family HTH domain